MVAGDFNGDGSTDLVVGGAAKAILLNSWSVQATATVSLQGIGNHALVANYGGDSDFVASASTPVTVTNGVSTTLTLTAGPGNAINAGQPAQITATITPNNYHRVNATGTVSFLDGQNQIGQQPLNSSGQTTFTTSPDLPFVAHWVGLWWSRQQ